MGSSKLKWLFADTRFYYKLVGSQSLPLRPPIGVSAGSGLDSSPGKRGFYILKLSKLSPLELLLKPLFPLGFILFNYR